MIGRNIRWLRERKHLTQEELAGKIGVTRQAVSNWENERTKPDIETGLLLSRILDASLEEIICGVNQEACEETADSLLKNAACEEVAECGAKQEACEEAADRSVNQEVHENAKDYSAGRNAEKGEVDCSRTGECAQSDKFFEERKSGL